MAFSTCVPVRFGDVDHAGIVFYPQFFIYFHTAFEQFFSDNGIPYHELIGKRRVGFPTVHLETDFKKPLRYGDTLDIALSVPRISQRSATFCYTCHRTSDAALACVAQITCACIDMDQFCAIEIPTDIRALFERFGR